MHDFLSNLINVLLVFILMGSLCQSVNAQIGFSHSFSIIDAPNWQENIRNDFRWSPSYKFGFDYQLELSSKNRIYFQPGFFYARFSETRRNLYINIQDNSTTFKTELLELNLNTNIYLFDLKGDYSGSTFTKNGSIIKKGFFIQISPGLTYSRSAIKDTAEGFSGVPPSLTRIDISPNFS